MLPTWVPFAVAALLQILSPFTDKLWKPAFLKFFDSLPTVDTKSPQSLSSAASWASDVAQSLPNSALTIIGIVSLFTRSQGAAVGAFSIVALIVLLVCILAVAHDTDHLYDYDNRRWLLWSRLQWLQFFINILGLLAATLINRLAPST